jgi:CrcB protein
VIQNPCILGAPKGVPFLKVGGEFLDIFLVAIGGAVGAVSRYIVSRVVSQLAPMSRIPWGTISVNVIGSFFLSLIVFSSIERGVPSRNFILLFGTGFLGAFTTFSTFTYETLALFEENPTGAFMYVLSNLLFSLTSAYFGMILGKGWKF